jgi:hypothetical protein
VITPLGRCGFKHRADFVAFQVIHGTGWSTLDAYSQEALGLFHLLGIPCREKSGKRMNGRQTGVAGSDAILPLGFEMIQKREDIVSPQVLEPQKAKP